MVCNHCGKTVSGRIRFCPHCGNEVWTSKKISLPAFATEAKKVKNKTSNDSARARVKAKYDRSVSGGVFAFFTVIGKINNIATIFKFIIIGVLAFIAFGIPFINHVVQEVADANDWRTYGQYENKVIDIIPISDVTAGGEYFEMGQWRGEPIVWRVLEVRDGQALIVTEEILTARQYEGFEEYGGRLAGNHEIHNTDITWADSDIRAWLNGDFMSNAFSKEEAGSILQSDIETPVYTYRGNIMNWRGSFDKISESGTTATEDALFLLSAYEAEKYFTGKGDRVARLVITQQDADEVLRIYDEDLGYEQESLEFRRSWYEENTGNAVSQDWWLRSAENGEGILYMTTSDYTGNISVGYPYYALGVRPAMWINLSTG